MATDKYTLYLDESTTHNNHRNQVFCMAGVIIKDSEYSSIIVPEMKSLKKSIWYDVPSPENIIIHQKEVNDGQKCRTQNPDFVRFRQNRYSRMLYGGLDTIFSRNSLTVIGTCIIIDDLNRFFVNSIKRDKYLIALQLLLENYCHFLSRNNGIGKIVYESRTETDNEKMRMRFYHIKLMGSMYIDAPVMLKRLTTIEFPSKKDNVEGLQIADFVPNYFARKQLNKPQKRINIDNQLRRCRYDGNLNLRDRFGVKIMP